MPRLSDKIPIKNELLDRRVKLTQEQKREIRALVVAHSDRAKRGIAGEAISQRILARRYGVSRRLIVWVLYPDRYKKFLQHRRDIQYHKEIYRTQRGKKWRETMRDHRNYKRQLYLAGKLGGGETHDKE